MPPRHTWPHLADDLEWLADGAADIDDDADAIRLAPPKIKRALASCRQAAHILREMAPRKPHGFGFGAALVLVLAATGLAQIIAWLATALMQVAG